MGTALKQAFSYQFSATIWNTLVVPNRNILILETRDDKSFKTKFSALDFKSNKFLWKDIEFPEAWWIGMTAANEDILLLHTFVNKGNPDRKNLSAFEIFTQRIRWEADDFSFFDWDASEIRGYATRNELTKVTIAVETGVVKEQAWEAASKQEKDAVITPQLYLEGGSHFETLKRFMEQKAKVHLKGGVEYLEFQDLILISAYQQENGLANYLYVFDRIGEIVLQERLGEKLQGLGVDTFFILEGCLFLVKNKSELVAFSVYD